METSDAHGANQIVRRTPSRLAPAVGPRPVGPPGLSASLSPRTVLRAARRWWWQIAVIWVVGTAVICGGVQFGMKPTYEAGSLLRIEPTAQDLFGQANYNVSSFQNYLETQVELVTSTNVLLAAAADPRLAGVAAIRNSPDAERSIRRMVQVRIVPKSYLIRISSYSPSATVAADVTNAVVDAYLKADAEWSDGMSRHLIKNLETYQKGLQVVVDEKQKAWLELAAKGNIDLNGVAKDRSEAATPSLTSLTIEEYQRVRSQLFQTDLSLGEAEAVLATQHEAALGIAAGVAPVAEGAIEQEVRADPEVVEVHKQLDQLEIKRAMMAKLARDAHDPAIEQVSLKIKRLKGRYGQLLQAKREEIDRRGDRSPDDSALQTIKDAQLRAASLRATKAKLEASLGRLEITNREQNTDSVKITLIQADLRHLEEMQAAVNRRLEQYRYEARGQAKIRRISEAIPSGGPASDMRPRLLALAPIVALGLVMGFFTLLEVRAGRICNPADLSRLLTSELFLVPQLPGTSIERGNNLAEKAEVFVHRIDHIRDAICGGMHASQRGRCVFITSAVGGEGKTELSRHIAFRCASAGAATLLIDADLRRATLSRILDVSGRTGLSDVLQGRVSLETALVKLDPQLSCQFLAAGTPEANPGRVFQDVRFAVTLERLRQLFEIIIIDTPPVLPVPDGLTLGRWTDGAILATRHDTSRLHLVEEASRMLAAAKIPILATVVNGVLLGEGSSYGYQTSRVAAPPVPSLLG